MMVFKVAIGPAYTLVKAPTAEAAALFAGLHIDGNAQLLARIVEVDGMPYTGDSMPWAKYHHPAYHDQLGRAIEQIRPQFYLCSYVSPSGYHAPVAIHADMHIIALPKSGDLVVEVEIRRSEEMGRMTS